MQQENTAILIAQGPGRQKCKRNNYRSWHLDRSGNRDADIAMFNVPGILISKPMRISDWNVETRLLPDEIKY